MRTAVIWRFFSFSPRICKIKNVNSILGQNGERDGITKRRLKHSTRLWTWSDFMFPAAIRRRPCESRWIAGVFWFSEKISGYYNYCHLSFCPLFLHPTPYSALEKSPSLPMRQNKAEFRNSAKYRIPRQGNNKIIHIHKSSFRQAGKQKDRRITILIDRYDSSMNFRDVRYHIQFYLLVRYDIHIFYLNASLLFLQTFNFDDFRACNINETSLLVTNIFFDHFQHCWTQPTERKLRKRHHVSQEMCVFALSHTAIW